MVVTATLPSALAARIGRARKSRMAYIHATSQELRMTPAAALRALGTPDALAELARRKANREAKAAPKAAPAPAFAYVAQPAPAVVTPVPAPAAAPAPVVGRGKGGRVTLTQRVEAIEAGMGEIKALLMQAIKG